ncbi:hypothetical protein SDC9_20695 [bioreactor metagenome]|uniref:Uncharacterized protein n=1 Tax=bioreactor metagenome TaxID=1076179 RepID=A0A644U7G3_9ZZZZ
MGQRLAEGDDRHQELQRRVEIEHHPHRRQPHPLRGIGEQHQRPAGQHAREHEQRAHRPVAAEAARVRRKAPAEMLGDQQRQREGGEQHHLGTDRNRRRQVDALLDQPVEPEGDGEGQRDPRRLAQRPGQPQHRTGDDQHRQRLQPPHPLAQEDHAKRHRDQREDVIAKARFHRVAVLHRPDEAKPVDRDQHRRQRQGTRLPRVAQRGDQVAELALKGQYHGKEHHRPDRAMRQHLKRRHRREQLVIDAGKPPGQTDSEQCPEPLDRLAHVHPLPLRASTARNGKKREDRPVRRRFTGP